MKYIKISVISILIMTVMNMTAFAETLFNLDLPMEIYEAAYHTLEVHSQDGSMETTPFYRLEVSVPEGIDPQDTAVNCEYMLGSSDVIVMYFQDVSKAFLKARSFIDGTEKCEYVYYHGGSPALWVAYKPGVDPSEAFTEIADTKAIASMIAASSPSDTDSAYRYICKTLADRCSYDDRGDAQCNNEVRSAAGCLKNGYCVCAGYAKAFSLVCYLKGIPAYYTSCLLNGEKHAENAVYNNGRYVWVDVTNYDANRSEEYILQKPVDMNEWGGLFTKGQSAVSGDTSFSSVWYQTKEGSWIARSSDGSYVRNAWLCDDAVASNGKNVWYLIDSDGTMLSAGLIRDNTGNYYSLETSHNGYYGMLRYKNGDYDGIYIEFSQAHDGTFGAIINAEAIEALKARYGVTVFTVGNNHCVYTSMM